MFAVAGVLPIAVGFLLRRFFTLNVTIEKA